MRVLVAFSLLTILLGRPVQAGVEGCLSYEPDRVTLTGTIEKARGYGPPGFGEHPMTDKAEPYEVLKLDGPVCVLRRDDIDVAEQDVRRVELVFSKSPYRSGFDGRHVHVVGMLFHQATGHHHTIVLVTVDNVAP